MRCTAAATSCVDSHLKLRAKEYYDLHPELTETATDARQLVRFQPILWLELKHKDRREHRQAPDRDPQA